MSDVKFHLASFPRSGNHVLRAILEYSFGRPTKGCFGSKKDSPIHERKPNLQARVIAISNSEPIGFKSHALTEIFRVEKSYGELEGFILLIRDPVDAIASHAYRTLKWADRFKTIDYDRLVAPDIENYLKLLYYFSASQHSKKFIVEFEYMVTSKMRLTYVNGFLDKIGSPRLLQQQELSAILTVSKESQESLGFFDPRMMEGIRSAVANVIDYSKVKNLLSTRGEFMRPCEFDDPEERSIVR